jgi:hypothetical protein
LRLETLEKFEIANDGQGERARESESESESERDARAANQGEREKKGQVKSSSDFYSPHKYKIAPL